VLLDGVPFGQAKADATGAWSWTANLRVADGTHTVKAQATDAAGSAGLFSSTFELSTSEPGVLYECRLDGASFAACTSPVTFSELADGTHTLEVRARDQAGHEDPTPARHSWSVVHGDTVEGGGMGCSTPGGATALASLGWLGLAWLLARRRRS